MKSKRGVINRTIALILAILLALLVLYIILKAKTSMFDSIGGLNFLW